MLGLSLIWANRAHRELLAVEQVPVDDTPGTCGVSEGY